MATSSIALLLACAAFAAYDRVSTRRWLVNDTSADARIIGTNITAALAFSDHDSATEVLSGLSIRTDISRGRVYTKNGEPFAEYSRADVQDSSPQPTPELESVQFLNGYLLVSEPITLDGENIGTVCLVSDTKQLKGASSKVYRHSWGGSFWLPHPCALDFLQASACYFRTYSAPCGDRKISVDREGLFNPRGRGK